MTVNEWYALYLSTYKTDLRPRTRAEYERLFASYLAPVIGSVELSELTPELCQSAINGAAAHGGRTAQAVHALLRATLRRAVRSRLILWSPLEALDAPRHVPQPGRALTGEHYEAACDIARDELGVALALHAGLRRGELLALTWRDVDLARGVLHVHAQLVQAGQIAPPKSAAGVRDVPISPELAPLLRASRQLRGRVVPICAPTLARRWRAAQRDAGIPEPLYRLHDLRHTYASRLLMAGLPLKVLQYTLGHASMELTANTYCHVSPADALAACSTVYAAALQ